MHPDDEELLVVELPEDELEELVIKIPEELVETIPEEDELLVEELLVVELPDEELLVVELPEDELEELLELDEDIDGH